MVPVDITPFVKTARFIAELWRTARLATHGKSRCMEEGCARSPEIECVWADGRGRAWFCEPHFKTWSKTEDEGLPRDIVKQRKVPDGVVGEKYGEYPKTATDAPVFLDYDEAMAWVAEQSKSYGSKQKFLTSDEYKKAYPLIKRLHQEASSSNAAARAKAMQAEGLSYGDRVSYSTFSLIGGAAHFEGILVDRGGQPSVKLDRAHDGKRHVLWNRGWKKQSHLMSEASIVTKVAKQNYFVLSHSDGGWPVAPLLVADRDKTGYMTTRGAQDKLLIAGFATEPEAKRFADKLESLKIEVVRSQDATTVFQGALLDFARSPAVRNLRYVDRGRLLSLTQHPEAKLGQGKSALIARRAGAANIRAAAEKHFAKVNGVKTGDGEGVGLFIPLPKNLAKKFPSLGEEDDSPSHTTFLYIGDFKNKKQQEILVEKMKDICRRYWPNIKATLSGLDYFDHHDKDRRVPHVRVEFDRDMSGFRHKVKQELLEAGIEVLDSFPEYKPHVTLAYMPGMDSEWKGRVPKGSWDFDTIEIWGLPQVHKLKLGPSLKKISETWLRGYLAAALKDRDAP